MLLGNMCNSDMFHSEGSSHCDADWHLVGTAGCSHSGHRLIARDVERIKNRQIRTLRDPDVCSVKDLIESLDSSVKPPGAPDCNVLDGYQLDDQQPSSGNYPVPTVAFQVTPKGKVMNLQGLQDKAASEPGASCPPEGMSLSFF